MSDPLKDNLKEVYKNMQKKKLTTVELGDKVKDKLTGFIGTTFARCEYLTGCTQFGVMPAVGKDGALPTSYYFDVDRLVVVKKGVCKIDVQVEGSMTPPGNSSY